MFGQERLQVSLETMRSKSSIKAIERDQSEQGELHSECKHRQRRGLESWPVTAASGGFIHECHRGNGNIRKPGKGSRAGADALQCDLKTAFGKCLKYLPEDSSQQS